MFQDKTKENKKENLKTQTNQKQVINSKIIEINSIDTTVKEIVMLVHKNDMANGNGLDFRTEYVKKYMSTLIDKPVVCTYLPLDDDLSDHDVVFDEYGNITQFRTLAIGTITDVWIGDYEINDEVKTTALYAKATLWDYKYPQVISCIERLFDEGFATSSVEVEIYQYGDNPTRQYRYGIDFTYLSNCLLGSTVAPADADAGITNITYKEIAQAIKHDLLLETNQEINGGEEMSEESKKKLEFNNGKKIVFKTEISELSYEDIAEDIFKQLNGFSYDDYWEHYDEIKYTIEEVYQTYVIIEDEIADKYFKVGYSIVDDVVSLQDTTQWIEVKEAYIPVQSSEINNADEKQWDEVVSATEKTQNMDTEINNKEELNAMEEKVVQLSQEVANKNVEIESLQGKVSEFEGQVAELNSKIEELNGLVVSKTEEVAQRDEQITELNTQVEGLTVYKNNFEKAEKEAKQAELNQKYSKLITKEVFTSDRVKQAIEECNVTELNSIVVEESLKAKEIEVNNASEDIVVNASSASSFAPELSIREQLYASSEE